MNAFQKDNQLTLYLSYSVLGVIFLIDCFVEFGPFGGIPYVIGLIVLMWLLRPSEVLWFSATCGGLTILAFLMGEDHTELSGLMNRFMAIFTMVAIAMLIKRHTEVNESHVEQQKHLNSVVEKRTEGLKLVVDQLAEMKIRLAESEELGHFGFWEYYPSTQEMVWSNGVFAIYGFPITPQAPSMQEFLDQCHTEDLPTFQRSIQYGLAEKKSYTVEYRVIMPDGGVKWIFNKGRPIVDKQGKVELLVGTIQDVTNRKHSEDSLQANRARYTTLFKSAGVGKALMIPNKIILEVNQAFAKWIGYSEKSLLKIPIEKLIHKDDRSMDDAYAREMVSGEIHFYQKEKRFVRRDGTILWGLYSVSPVHDVDDKITCFAVEVVDITGHKNMQMAFQKAQDSWHETEEALTESEASRRLAESALRESEAARQRAEEKLEAIEKSRPHADQSSDRSSEVQLAEERQSDRLAEPDITPPATEVTHPVGDELPVPQDAVKAPTLKTPTLTLQPDRIDAPVPKQADVPVQKSGAKPVTEIRDGKQEPASRTSQRRDLIFSMTDDDINNLFKLTRDLMAVIGLDGCYKRVSPALTRELGFEDGELDGQHFLNFIHLDDRDYVHDEFYNLESGSTISNLKLRHMSKFDGYRRFLWNASVNEEHEVIYSVLKPAIDLGDFEPEPIRAEIPVKQADSARETEPAPVTPAKQAAPVRSRQPASSPEKPSPDPVAKPARQVDWHRLTDRMPFQVWMLGSDQLCRYVNKKVRDYTGLPFEQLEGKGWSKTVHPEDYREYVAYYKSAFDNWKPMGCTYRLRRNDGEYRWMQESGVPIQKENGSYEGYLVTCMEISSLNAIGSKFINAFDDAVNLVDLKSALRSCKREESQHTFIDSIKIADALVANSKEVPNSDLAKLIALAGNRLLDLIKGILSFSYADKDAHELLMRSVSLETVLESTIEMLAPLKREDGPRFQIKYSDSDVRVKVDKVLTHRLFENLMRNLIEWAESRVMTLHISERGDVGVVEIKHIGPVLPPDFLNHLDNIFRAGASSHLQKKAGLELSLIRKLTEAMGGQMDIRHDEDSEPVIELRFNLAKQEDADDAVLVVDQALRGESPREPAKVRQLTEVVEAIASLEAPPPSIAIDEPVQKGTEEEILIHENGTSGKEITRHRVLVGETNSETQRLVRSLLQPYYDLTIVPNTDDLLKRADESQFDLLLLDVHMQGGRSGVDVLRELRRRPQYTRTPAIAVAASTSAIDQRELIDRGGFDGFLRKPYSIVELLETVERMIET